MTFDENKDALGATIPRNEKVSWKRKSKVLEKLMEELDPLEDTIMELMLRKNKIVDKMVLTRNQMVQECIHPDDHLVETDDGTLFCKFCNKELSVVSSTNG